jgi:hypothetical protein
MGRPKSGIMPRHIQSGRNLQMAGASHCEVCGLTIADIFMEDHLQEQHPGDL